MGERSKFSRLGGSFGVTQFLLDATVGAGAALTRQLFTNNFGAKIKITKIAYVPDVAMVGDDTNNNTLSVENRGLDGAQTDEVASIEQATGVDAVAFREFPLTLSTTPADLEVEDGETLVFKKTAAGSGLVLQAGQVSLTFEFA